MESEIEVTDYQLKQCLKSKLTFIYKKKNLNISIIKLKKLF